MKKPLALSFLFLLLLVLSTSANAQGYAADISLGIGNVSSRDHGQGKIQLGIMCVREILKDRAQLGVEITLGGNFIPDGSIADVTGLVSIAAADAKWTSLQFKGRYFIDIGMYRPFVGLGLGANNYWFNVNTVEAERVNRWNFSFTPEIGLGIDKVSIALQYVFGGTTPDFNGTRPIEYGGNEVVLTSERLNLIFLTLGYTFSFK